MKNVLFVCLLFFSAITSAQTSTKYYKSRPFEDEVSQEKARYSETIINENGVITTIVKDLKKDKIEYAFRGNEPIGVWSGGNELNYDFELRYEQPACVNPEEIRRLPDFFADNDMVGYKAPVIDFKEPEFMIFIQHNLRYPARARRTGIQGTVELAFTVTTEGTVQDVVVTKGVDVGLDKEAVRVIRLLKFSKPAMLNGKPQQVCIKKPLKFKLA